MIWRTNNASCTHINDWLSHHVCGRTLWAIMYPQSYFWGSKTSLEKFGHFLILLSKVRFPYSCSSRRMFSMNHCECEGSAYVMWYYKISMHDMTTIPNHRSNCWTCLLSRNQCGCSDLYSENTWLHLGFVEFHAWECSRDSTNRQCLLRITRTFWPSSINN